MKNFSQKTWMRFLRNPLQSLKVKPTTTFLTILLNFSRKNDRTMIENNGNHVTNQKVFNLEKTPEKLKLKKSVVFTYSAQHILLAF